MELNRLPLVLSLILTLALRLLHPYNTDDKTSRLVVKQFSTVRDIQRSSQTYMEKREMKIEVTRKKRGGSQKRREQSSQ